MITMNEIFRDYGTTYPRVALADEIGKATHYIMCSYSREIGEKKAEDFAKLAKRLRAPMYTFTGKELQKLCKDAGEDGMAPKGIQATQFNYAFIMIKL